MNQRKTTHAASNPPHWLAAIAAGLASISVFSSAGASPLSANPIPNFDNQLSAMPHYSFRHDSVLGTSMEVTIESATPAGVLACHHAILTEIDRLNRILSTYDSTSDISRLKSSPAPNLLQSPNEIGELLAIYAAWQNRTDGVINPHMAVLIATWKSAARINILPTIDQLLDSMRESGLSNLNIDALGKGFIIDRAVAVARQYAPGGLLNIGGDLRAWGDPIWRIEITDPANPADNAAPLATFDLSNAAVTTSGGYLRYYTIAGQRYSHVIDPRTLQPTQTDISATVVAADCVTANALSTAACILGPSAGAELAARNGGVGYLFADSAGIVAADSMFKPTQRRLAGQNSLPFQQSTPIGGQCPPYDGREIARTPLAAAAAAAGAWPKDFAVNIDITLAAGGGGKRYRRPYVATWIEDSTGKAVRTISMWGNRDKYVREMTGWWRATNGGKNMGKGVTRATRDPGKYSVAWDGLDDAGKPLPKGDYTVWVEVNREHGGHVKQSAVISCGDKAASATLKASAESEETAVTYGPKGK